MLIYKAVSLNDAKQVIVLVYLGKQLLSEHIDFKYKLH